MNQCLRTFGTIENSGDLLITPLNESEDVQVLLMKAPGTVRIDILDLREYHLAETL